MKELARNIILTLDIMWLLTFSLLFLSTHSITLCNIY